MIIVTSDFIEIVNCYWLLPRVNEIRPCQLSPEHKLQIPLFFGTPCIYIYKYISWQAPLQRSALLCLEWELFLIKSELSLQLPHTNYIERSFFSSQSLLNTLSLLLTLLLSIYYYSETFVRWVDPWVIIHTTHHNTWLLQHWGQSSCNILQQWWLFPHYTKKLIFF